MLLDSFVTQAKPDPSKSLLLVRGREVPLIIARNLKARRYLLRLRSDGSIRLTIPRRGSIREGRKFAESKTGWLARELEKFAAVSDKSKVWTDGTSILFRGALVTLKYVNLTGSCSVQCDEETIAIPPSLGDLRTCVERYLRSLATKELTARTEDLASQHQLTVKRITIRDQRSRWGSCSPKGVISLNWRLIQTPQFVSDYIVLHELMHLRQMNHSSRFWREVERVCPDYMIAERWLRQHSGLLRE